MREFVRPIALALSVACAAGSTAIVFSGDALAQSQMAPAQGATQEAPPLKQMALTEKQVQGVLRPARTWTR